MFIYGQIARQRIFRKYSSSPSTSLGINFVEKNEINSSRLPATETMAGHSNNNSKGLSLVAVVIVMLIAATLALFVASSMSSGNMSAITDMQSEQAFYVAQAGMEWYLEQLEGDGNWNTPPAVKTNQAFGAGTFSITYSNNSKNAIDLVGIGKVTAWDGNTVQRVISCHVARGTPLVISLWQETL